MIRWATAYSPPPISTVYMLASAWPTFGTAHCCFVGAAGVRGIRTLNCPFGSANSSQPGTAGSPADSPPAPGPDTGPPVGAEPSDWRSPEEK